MPPLSYCFLQLTRCSSYTAVAFVAFLALLLVTRPKPLPRYLATFMSFLEVYGFCLMFCAARDGCLLQVLTVAWASNACEHTPAFRVLNNPSRLASLCFVILCYFHAPAAEIRRSKSRDICRYYLLKQGFNVFAGHFTPESRSVPRLPCLGVFISPCVPVLNGM